MSLLIKKGIFEEELARFYIAELTCAIDSVHKMGFIHRYEDDGMSLFVESFLMHICFCFTIGTLNLIIY